MKPIHALALAGVLVFSVLGIATANRSPVELQASSNASDDSTAMAQVQLPISPLPPLPTPADGFALRLVLLESSNTDRT